MHIVLTGSTSSSPDMLRHPLPWLHMQGQEANPNCRAHPSHRQCNSLSRTKAVLLHQLGAVLVNEHAGTGLQDRLKLGAALAGVGVASVLWAGVPLENVLNGGIAAVMFNIIYDALLSQRLKWYALCPIVDSINHKSDIAVRNIWTHRHMLFSPVVLCIMDCRQSLAAHRLLERCIMKLLQKVVQQGLTLKQCLMLAAAGLHRARCGTSTSGTALGWRPARILQRFAFNIRRS